MLHIGVAEGVLLRALDTHRDQRDEPAEDDTWNESGYALRAGGLLVSTQIPRRLGKFRCSQTNRGNSIYFQRNQIGKQKI